MIDVSTQVLELTNATIVALFGFMLVSAASYFISRIRCHKDLRSVYAESKASFAATILFAGLFVRQAVVWWARHVVDHGYHVNAPSAHALSALLFACSAPIVWGSICWMRAVLPLDLGPVSWVIVAGASIAFGVLAVLF